MQRLGYTQFVASGGDWGDPVTEQMAVLAPSDVLGIHLNMPSAVPAEVAKALESGGPPPAGLSADERQAYDQLDFFFKYGLGNANEMRLRPQTLYAIEDSPVGWPPGSSTMKHAVTSSSLASSTATPRGSRGTTSSTTSRYG